MIEKERGRLASCLHAPFSNLFLHYVELFPSRLLPPISFLVFSSTMLRPLQNIENHTPSKRKYHLHIDLDAEYEPLHKRNTNSTLSSVQKDCARLSGAKHIDVWTDEKSTLLILPLCLLQTSQVLQLC